MRLRIFAILSVFATGSLIAHGQSLIGSNVDVQYLVPNTSTVFQDFGSQTVTEGLTDIIVGDDESLTFGQNTITITNRTPGQFGPAPFSGFSVSFLSGATIDDVTYDPSSSLAFETGSDLTFSSSNISLNLAGTCAACNGGESIILDVKPAASATPEPSSLALLGTGILGAVGILRKRFV